MQTGNRAHRLFRRQPCIGTRTGSGNLEFYGSNLTDEYAELTRYARAGDSRVVTNRPMTIGLRYQQRF